MTIRSSLFLSVLFGVMSGACAGEGTPGEMGEMGTMGVAGPAGPQGPQGDRGDVGPQGLQGERGLQGIQGVPGQMGQQGIQGIQGVPGTPGTPGTNGTNGAQGDQGPQGDPGPPGTFSGTFTGATTFTGNATFNGNTAVSGNASIGGTTTSTGRLNATGGLSFGGRVFKGPVVQGVAFENDTFAGVNACNDPAFHVCTAWEAMVIDTISAEVVFDASGWVIGSFPNQADHMRSLVNGQDSFVCPLAKLMVKFPSNFAHGQVLTPGGLHCVDRNELHNIYCCRNKQ